MTEGELNYVTNGKYYKVRNVCDANYGDPGIGTDRCDNRCQYGNLCNSVIKGRTFKSSSILSEENRDRDGIMDKDIIEAVEKMYAAMFGPVISTRHKSIKMLRRCNG